MSWTILASAKMDLDTGETGLFPTWINGVLSIEEDDMGRQRARFTDGSNSRKMDVAWAWEMIES